MTRRDDLAAGLRTVRGRIERACADAARDPAEVTLVVVTKYFPVEDVQHLLDLGVRHIGESRDQEAAAKVAVLREGGSVDASGVTVHFIGQLQSNKAASVAAYADVVHSVDRERLVTALDHGARRAGRLVDVLLQVSLDGDADRGGAPPEGIGVLADATARAERLRLGGLMAVAPLAADPDEAFARLAEMSGRLRVRHPAATVVSAGMSGDLEAAVRHGATHLRVGSAILGSRPANR